MVLDKVTRTDKLFPLGEGRTDAVIGVGDLAGCQVVVNVVTVGAQVQIVEHTGSGPQILGADGDRGDAVFLQLGTGCQQLVPGLRLGDAVLVQNVLPVINAPLIVGIGNAPLLAVAGHGRLDRLERAAEVRIRRPQSGQIFEQAGINKRAHTVSGIPSGHIWRASRKEVTDGWLVCLAVIDAQLDIDVGVGCLEILDNLFKRRFRRRVQVVEDDHKVVCRGRGRKKRRRGGKGCKSLFHDVLPKTETTAPAKCRTG